MTYSVALAQVSLFPVDVDGNLKTILRSIEDAKKSGAKIIVFPELSLSGYFALDKTFDPEFLKAQQKALDEIAKNTSGIIAVVGFMRWEEGKFRSGRRPIVYNSAAVFEDGKFIGHQDKKLLPDYDIFDETRYFIPGSETKVFSTSIGKIGVQICEDLWIDGYNSDPTLDLVKAGAEIIINLSASPFEVGRLEIRRKLICDAAKRAKLPFIYVNLVAGLDGFEGEITFDGRSMIVSREGEVFYEAPFGISGVFVQDLDSNEKYSPTTWSEPQEIYSTLIFGLRSYFARFGINKAIVGVSGGIDSAVVAALAASAFGKDKVHAVSMPSQFNSKETRNDAIELAKNLGVSFEEIPIDSILSEYLTLFSKSTYYAKGSNPIAEENLQSRIRMAILFGLSNRTGGLVLNTGNKTEFALGYSTIYGDLAGSIAVLGDVNKRQVYDLANYINTQSNINLIPESIIKRAPSAELRPSQTDAQGMGAEPALIGDFIDAYLLAGTIKTPPPKGLDDTVVNKLISSIERAEWKRRQAPPAIRVSSKAFGHGRRVPMR